MSFANIKFRILRDLLGGRKPPFKFICDREEVEVWRGPPKICARVKDKRTINITINSWMYINGTPHKVLEHKD